MMSIDKVTPTRHTVHIQRVKQLLIEVSNTDGVYLH